MKQISSYIFVILFILLISFGVVYASTTNGTIPANAYAWGENMGWINFGCTNCHVAVTDTAVTGDAWSIQYGWINLAPTNGGVTNDGEGHLGGTAWSSGLGWISFSGVTINTSGIFTGIAGNAASTSGRINFDCTHCSVTTDWRPLSVRNGGASGSGSSGSSGTSVTYGGSSFGSYIGSAGGQIGTTTTVTTTNNAGTNPSGTMSVTTGSSTTTETNTHNGGTIQKEPYIPQIHIVEGRSLSQFIGKYLGWSGFVVTPLIGTSTMQLVEQYPSTSAFAAILLLVLIVLFIRLLSRLLRHGV